MKIDFCLPAYNEKEIVEANVKKLLTYCLNKNFSFDWQIVVIVNGSSDSFVNQAQKIALNSDEKVKAVVYPQKGKGGALKKYAMESESDIFVYMDIDLAASIEDIPLLVDPIINDDYDFVIGSRMLPGSVRKRSFFREFSSQSYVLLSQLILGHHFSDMQCGFKAIKTSLFKKIVPLIEDNFWFFDTELIYFAMKDGAKIKEIPINWSENRYDKRKSKINVLENILDFIIKLLRLRFKHIDMSTTF